MVRRANVNFGGSIILEQNSVSMFEVVRSVLDYRPPMNQTDWRLILHDSGAPGHRYREYTSHNRAEVASDYSGRKWQGNVLLALASAGKSIAARMAMMAITTSNSINVKAAGAHAGNRNEWFQRQRFVHASTTRNRPGAQGTRNRKNFWGSAGFTRFSITEMTGIIKRTDGDGDPVAQGRNDIG